MELWFVRIIVKRSHSTFNVYIPKKLQKLFDRIKINISLSKEILTINDNFQLAPLEAEVMRIYMVYILLKCSSCILKCKKSG